MQLDGDLKPPPEELHPDPLTVFSYPKFKGLMRMEGEPHLTAWGFMGGSLKSEDLGFQQVASDGDLIFPQHVLGGYFVVGQEEKGRMSPLHMLEEPDRQGEIIQGPHPLPQAGRETGPCQQNCATDGWVVGPGMSKTALCPVDLTPEPSQRYLPHRWEHAPPSSNGFSEFNLPWPDLPQIPHLISGFSPNGDKLDLPDLPSPSETASLPPMVSILEAHQVPLSPIGNRPWITGHTLTLDWSWPQGNDVDNRYCESVLPRTGQNTAGKHYVPPGDGLHGAWEPYMPPEPDRPRCPESTLYTDNVNIAPSISDVLLPAGVPHGQLLMSESCLLVDTDQLSQSESCLIPDSDHLPQFDACLPPATDHLPQSEACLPPATDQLHQSEWCLPSATDQLPQSESCLHPDTNQLLQSKSCLLPPIDQLPQSESCLPPDTDQLPQSQACLSPCQLPGSESYLPFSYLPLPQSSLPPGNLYIPLSDSCVVSASHQLPPPVFSLAPDSVTGPLSEFCLPADPVQVSDSSLAPDSKSELLTDPTLTPISDQGLPPTSYLTPDSDSLLLSGVDPSSSAAYLPVGENESPPENVQLPKSQTFLFSEDEPAVLFHCSLTPDSRTGPLDYPWPFLKSEEQPLPDYDVHGNVGELALSHSCVSPESDPFQSIEQLCVPKTDYLPLSGVVSENEQLVMSESGGDSETEQLLLSECGNISQAEQLVKSESIVVCVTEQLVLSESGSASETEQLVLSESGVSETEQLVLSESDGDSENEQLSLSEFCNVSQTELLVLSESGNVSQTEHLVLSESGSAAETEQLVLSESGSASETEQPVLSESGVSETEQLVLSEFDGDSENEQLSLSESGNVSQTEHLVLSESGSAAETEHLVLSESGSAAETEQLVLSEPGISETEQLVLSESDGDSETEQLSLSESGNVSQTEQLVLSESGSAAEAEHLVLSESGSAAETEQIVLSETALASDSEQLVLSESGVVSVTEQLVLSESGSLAEYEEVVVSESGVLSETEQLVLIKSDAVSETQKLELSESNSVFETDQLVLSDSSAVTEFDQPVLFESGVASDTELLILSEYSGVSEMEQLILSVTNVFETKKLILSESNDSETEQLVLSELSADSETEQLVLSELGADSETEQLVLSELGADSETEQLVLSEFNVAHETEKPELSQSGWVTHSDQSAWCDSGLITDTGQPAKSEPGLAPVTDQLILPNTGMAPAANHPALSSSGMVPDPGQPILSELCWVPNTDQLVLSESGLTPDNDKFIPNTEHPTLSEPSLPPDTILTLSDSALILDTDQLFLSECCLVNAPDQLALPESTRGPDFEQLAFSMSKTDLALDTNKLPMSELILAPDPEQQAMSDSSLTLDTEHLDLSESDTAPDTKRLTAEFNLDRDPEQLVLSECDLSIDSNEFVFCESSLTPDPEQLVLSEFQFSTATIQLPMSESSFSHDCETLELSESELATDSKQLILSDSNVTPDEQLVLSDSDLGTYTNQLAMSDSSLAPASNPALSESSLAFHTEQLVLSESDLAPNTKHLTLPDCNLTPYEQLLLSESDNNQPATPECSWTPCTEQLELSESDLTPDEQPVLFESDVAIHTNQSESSWAPCTEQRVLRESDFTPVTRKLALSESSLASNTELLVTCESGLASDIGKLFLSDSSLAPDPDELPLSESGLAPDTTELNLAESDVTFAVDHLPITQSSLTADIEEPPLYKSGLAPDTEQPHLSVSTLTSDTNKNPFSDYTVTADHAYLPLHESCNSPNTSHLPIAEHNLSHDPDWLPFAEPDTKYPQGVPSGSTSLKESPLSFEPCLTPDTYPSNDTEQVSLSESYLTPINEQLPSPEVCQWFQSSLVLHADHMPQRQSESPEAKLVIHGKGYPLEWEFRDDDLFQTHVSFSGETEEPSLYESVFLSNRLSPSKLPYTNTEQAHLAEPRFPPGTGQLPLVDFLLDCDPVPSSNTNLLLNSGQNSFQVHEIEVGLPPPSDIFTGLSPESHELACTVEDLFSIFSPDTTQEPKGLSPNPDHLTLSDDFLSLTEVFAHLEEDPIHPNRMDEKGHQGCDLSRALTKFGPDYGTEPFVFAQLDPLFSNEQFLVSQQQSPSANVRLAHCGIGLPVEGIRFPIIQADTTVKTEQPVRCNSEDRFTPACFESSLEHLHKEREETPFLNLDLLFDPDNLQHEGGDSHFSIETTQIPLPQIDSLSENTKSPSSDVTDHLTGGDLGVKNALLPLSYSGSAITTGFLALSNTDPLSPVANQLSPLNPDFEPQKLSSFHLDTVQLNQLDINLATEIIKSQEVSFAENSQLPLIVVTDPVDLCSESPEAVEMQSLHPMENVTPYLEVHPAECSHMPEPQVEEPLEPDQLTPRDTKGHSPVLQSVEPQERRHQPPSQERSHLDDDDLSSCDVADTFPHCQPGLQYEDHQLMSSSAPLKLSLSFISSTFETGALLSCDVTVRQPGSTQDSSTSATLVEELDCDPGLGFSVDSDASCLGDEMLRLRAVFDALDRDKDGFVKMEDFVQFATVYGAEQVKYLTSYLDPAGLGVINFRDFYRGISEIQNEDLDMQLYDMGYPSEEEPPCSVDFDDLAAFEVTEVTDSAYVGSESAYSECETFTDEDTSALAAQEDPETEGDGVHRLHPPATPEGLEISLCDISVITVQSQEEQFEDFGEGAEPDLYSNQCDEEEEEESNLTQPISSSSRISSSGAPVSERQLLAPPQCTVGGGLYCSQCHKHVNRLEDLSTRLRYLEMDSPDKRTSSRKEARRLHNSSYLSEDTMDRQLTDMSYDETDLTDKVLYLEQRVSELEREAGTTGEQQNRLRQENLQLLHRAHALEEQLKDQELRSDEVQNEETRKHRDELRKMERDRGFELSSLKARVQELETENFELRSQLPNAKATTQRLEEENQKLRDQVDELRRQVKENKELNQKLGGRLNMEKHKQQGERERSQEVIEELRRELEQVQLLRLEMEHRLGLGNSAALQEYNSRTRETELEQEVRKLKQEQRSLKEQNEELNGQIINLSIQGAKNLFSTTFSDSLAAEISSVSRDELMEAIQKQEEINLRLQDYIDRIIVAIMETNPAILEVKIH